MAQYGWENCTADVRGQVTGFVDVVMEGLGATLVGVYLHGSLPMNCFNPARSDIDLLVVTHDHLTADEVRKLAEAALTYSGQPRPFELSSLPMSALHPWLYPTPYDFHFAEHLRDQLVTGLADGGWREWGTGRHTDPDLAAHITVTKARGICLTGQPIDTVFPDVPRADYLDSILADFAWARERLADNPTYAVLNFCRILMFLHENRITSKDEAGEWGVQNLPEYKALIRSALETYRGDTGEMVYDMDMAKRFADEMWERCMQLFK